MREPATKRRSAVLERLELEAFLALAEELHFGRTAQRLGVTTGRVSQIIKKLERLVGAPLFDRTNRSVRLSPLGQRLHDDLRPGYEQIQAGLDGAIASVRRSRSTLRVGFVGAAAGQVVHQARDLFQEREPDCRVHAREAQVVDAVARLNAGDVDVLVLSLPISGPHLVVGPVLISEPRLLAVPAPHPFARRESLVTEDLADIPILRLAGALPGDWPSDRWPQHTPRGRAIASGPRFETFQEALQLIAAGRGGYMVGEQVTRFYTRPDVAYVPLRDAPPIDWAPVWLKANNTPRVRAFARTAEEAARHLYAGAAR
ncbi:LysR family transcriptional regulator [Streptomyces sp. NPDC090022]|uniref:LysR family transcriptional regulator n=1 Tax=Streptomyces sp. NPDC090022 TaxID=3365920 RepID=UPI003806C12A